MKRQIEAQKEQIERLTRQLQAACALLDRCKDRVEPGDPIFVEVRIFLRSNSNAVLHVR